MAKDFQTQTPASAPSLPNYSDPETARLIEHWSTWYGVDGNGTPVKHVQQCPVCRYAMAKREEFGNRVVCTWDPAHTPAA